MTQGFGILLTGNKTAIGIAQVDGTTVAVEFERCLCLQITGTEPDHLIALGGHFAHVDGHLPFGQVVLIVAQIHASEINLLIGRIVHFNPTVEINGGTHDFSNIRGHQFIDN